MKTYESREIRNVALIGHGHSGKTTLASGMLFSGGATNRLTRVDEGNSITDFDEEEVARKFSIASAIAAFDWKKTKINLIDTPGFNILIQDTRSALIAAEAVLSVVDGVAGVEVQTEKTWQFAEEQQLPRAFVINKLDRERSSFDRTLARIQERFGRAAVPVHLPIGSEKEFKGVVDLVTMKAFLYTNDGDGKGKEQEIPAHLAEEAKTAHEVLVEMVAEGNDALLEEFFAEGTLPVEHIREGLRGAVLDLRIFPVLCASAFHNVGTDQILDFLTHYCPSPLERRAVAAVKNGQPEERKVCETGPASVFVFKTAADPFAGRVTYMKVFSGVVKNDANLQNLTRSTSERLAHISSIFGKMLVPVNELHAGDIGAVAKLKDTLTGDTLADKGAAHIYPPAKFAEPSIAFAIEAKSRQDEDRMGNAIHKILEEDPSLRFYRDPQTKEFLLGGAGQQHVEVIVSRLKKRYGVDVALKAPKIPYRETIRGKADVQGRHKKQTGGHGQFGDCWIRMEPLARSAGFVFENEVFGGAIPKNYIPAVEKGIIETAERGFLAGFPMVDFKVVVYDGSYHDVDSNELSFKLAARKAFKAAMLQAKPALLEPIMNVFIEAPVEYAGDLMGDLNGRRGRISGMDTRGGTQIIRAAVPMSEMLTYQSDLTSMTQGRASFSMEFDHYDYLPPLQAEKVIAAAKKDATHADEDEE